jgi:hypothetical protein
MLFPDSRFAANGRQRTDAAASGRQNARRRHGEPADAAIDRALRDVPLPDGLFTRLGDLVYSVSDTPVDRLDWLGC